MPIVGTEKKTSAMVFQTIGNAVAGKDSGRFSAPAPRYCRQVKCRKSDAKEKFFTVKIYMLLFVTLNRLGLIRCFFNL